MSLTTPYREQFLEADGITITFPFDDHGDGFDAISKNYVKCEVYNADGSVIVPDFTVDLSAKTITITSLTTPDGEVLNAPQNGAIVRIYRDVPEAQNTTAQALQASTAQQIVQNFDNIVAMIQELQYANEHFTLRSTLPQRDLKIDLLRDIDDQKLVYWDNEKRKLVVTNYRQDELLLPADKEDILAQANAYSDAKNDSLEEKINGKLSAVDTQIDANADAILKTREDFASADQAIRDDMNAEDSRLQTQITAQATAITTNKNDIDELGDDLAEIQAKIPESASGSNPLITKQQLLDEEMDIRDDVNEMVGELQTQITAQAGAIATLDSEKLDKNQGDINAGKYLVVGNDGNIELTSSGGGGGGGIGSVAHDETLTGAGTDESPLGVAKNLSVEELTVGTDEGTLNLSITAGVATIATNNGLDIVSQTKFDKAPTTDDNTTWADALDTSLVRKAQVASAMAGFEALPDQSGNSGKLLTTDGTTASWSDLWFSKGTSYKSDSPAGFALLTSEGNYPNLKSSIILGGHKSGQKTTAKCVTVVGVNASAMDFSVSVGYNSSCLGKNAVIINASGAYTDNPDANTFKVANANGNFEIMSANGTIPAERMSATAGTTGQVLTKTDAGMEWQEPSGGTTITLKEYDE